MKFHAIVFTIVAAQAVLAQAGEGFAFRVQVVNSITGAPIPSASVVVQSAAGPSTFGKSDAGGQFTGHLPSAGQYLLMVRHHGFRIVGTVPMGVTLNIEPSGENSVIVKLLPLGVITGRVLDQYGDPIRHALVHGLRKGQTPGLGEYFQGFTSGTTDDRGEYRIADVEPGKYYVAAEYGGHDTRGLMPELGGIVMYPDVTDIAGAQQLEVGAGTTTRVNDLHLKLQRAVTISGRVKPAGSVDLMLRRAVLMIGLNVSAGQGRRTEPDGSFSFQVLPGNYVLSASSRESGKLSKEITINAADRNVADIELALDSSYEINGHIVADGPGALDYSKIMLHFMGLPVKFASDGSFRANASAKAMYMLQSLPPGWYLKDVTVGGRTLAGRQFDLEPGTTEVSFHLKSDGGSIEFPSPSGGSEFLVLVLPENGPAVDVESMLHAEPGSSGKLVVHGVPPGSYRVFVLDATNFVYLYQPQLLLEKHKNVGTLITVAAGEHKSMVVPIAKIPPE